MPVTMVSTIKHDAQDASRSARIGGLLVAAFAFAIALTPDIFSLVIGDPIEVLKQSLWRLCSLQTR
jgi:hypothetical protein